MLDCCHAGGSTRADDSDDDSDKEMAVRYSPRGKAVPLASSPHPTSCFTGKAAFKGYTVLAAAQPNEYAYETYLGTKKNGRLTHHFLERMKTLRQKNQSTTYRLQLHQLRAIFHRNKYEWQNPTLLGDENLYLFTDDHPRLSYDNYDGSITEIMANGSLILNIGSAHGVLVGD